MALHRRRTSQPGRSSTELGPHHGIELTDAPETRGERDICQLPAGLIHQRPGSVGSPALRQLLGGSADLRDQHPVQMPLADTQPLGHRGDTTLIGLTIANGPDRACCQVCTVVPSLHPRKPVGTAASARPEASRHGCGRAGEKTTVLPPGQPGRTRWAAVDTGGGHRKHEMPIPRLVTTGTCPVAGVFVKRQQTHPPKSARGIGMISGGIWTWQ